MQRKRWRAALGAGAILLLGSCAGWVSPKQRESARISYDLGVESLNRQDYREALRALIAALDSDPYLPQAHQALGLVLHVLHRDDVALQHYRRALELKPDFSEAANNMGILLLDRGEYAAAIGAFERALRSLLYATPHLAEGNMGWAYYKLGKPQQAREHLEAALRLEPRFCRGYEWLARMAWEAAEGQGDAASHAAELVTHSRRFLRHCVDDPVVGKTVAADYRREMQYYLGLGLLRQGEPRQALEAFLQCTGGAAAAGQPADEATGADFRHRCWRQAGQARQALRQTGH